MEYEDRLKAMLSDESASQAESEEAGVRMIVLYVLKRRVGRLSTSLSNKVGALSIDQTLALAGAYSKFRSTSDLEAWLNSSLEGVSEP